MWNQKLVQMRRFAGQKLRHRCREQTYGHQWGKTVGGWGWWCAELGDWDWHVYTLMCIKLMANKNLLYKKTNKKTKRKKYIHRNSSYFKIKFGTKLSLLLGWWAMLFWGYFIVFKDSFLCDFYLKNEKKKHFKSNLFWDLRSAKSFDRLTVWFYQNSILLTRYFYCILSLMKQLNNNYKI